MFWSTVLIPCMLVAMEVVADRCLHLSGWKDGIYVIVTLVFTIAAPVIIFNILLLSLETWVLVPEGSLTGFFGRRHLALELISGADFSWKLKCEAGPGDLGGSRGSVWAQSPGEPARKF